MRKVFLENLPRKRTGNFIDWKNCVGYKVHFIYDDVEGDLEIIDYIRDRNSKLLLKYNKKEILMDSSQFKECRIGNLLNVNTSDFKVEIGTHIKDDKRDIIIIDREYRLNKNGQNCKYYKYKCNKCGWEEGWILETNLLTQNNRCSCCSNTTPVLGINTIWDTDVWMVPIVGENFAKHNFHSCGKITKCKCPYCGYEKDMNIEYVYRYGFTCPRCKDTFKYPEKFMFNFLNQININFDKEYTPKWSDNKRYDFYFEKDGKEYIIETHGSQHYDGGFERCGGKTLQEEQENDAYKKELALHNGIKEENYIIIDCRKSELEFIKNNILHSRLNEIFDLSNVDWIKIGEDSEKNLVKDISDYWNKGFTIKEISNKLNISNNIVRESLKKGSKIGWNNYNPKKEMVKGSKKINKRINLVEIFKDNVSLGVFKNCKDLERQSEKLFGVKLLNSAISEVANGKIKQYKGFTFKYV